MSTYNGERFLKEQIDSILSQEGVEIRLLVRDDGSKDRTWEILEEYASGYRNIVITMGENVGFVKSFSALVRMALDQTTIEEADQTTPPCGHPSYSGGEEDSGGDDWGVLFGEGTGRGAEDGETDQGEYGL